MPPAAELLQALADSVDEGAVATTVDGEILFYNARARRILGMTAVEQKSWPRARRIPLYRMDGTTPWPEQEMPLWRAMNGETVEGVEMMIRNHRHPDGIVLSVNARPVRGRNGGLLGGILVFRDITAKKKGMRELEESRQRLRALVSRVESAQEEERVRIAREIHDDLGQTLTALKFDASILARKLALGRPSRALAGHVRSMLSLIEAGMEWARAISGELRPPALASSGLYETIQVYVREFQARTGIRSEVRFRLGGLKVPDECCVGAFRIVQEALTNVARHSGARRVRVALTGRDGRLTLIVEDDGKGVTPEQAAAHSSLGLLGMRERAAAMGGEVAISGRAGKGASVVLRMPAASQQRGSQIEHGTQSPVSR